MRNLPERRWKSYFTRLTERSLIVTQLQAATLMFTVVYSFSENSIPLRITPFSELHIKPNILVSFITWVVHNDQHGQIMKYSMHFAF